MNVRKALSAALRPRFWPAFARGVVPTIEHRVALSAVDPRTVIDVEANKGQFSLFAAARWPNADIIAFEPLPKPGSIYRRVVPDRARLLTCALGAEPATLEMHVATRDDSSSLRPPGDRPSDVPWLYVEVSFRELYTGQKLFPELERLANRLGYRCAGLVNELVRQVSRFKPPRCSFAAASDRGINGFGR